MESVKDGVIGLYETRENLKAMRKLYQEEYRKLVREQSQIGWNSFVNKWKVRLGTFAVKLGFGFSKDFGVRFLGQLGTGIAGKITEKIIKVKSNFDKKQKEKQKEKLKADFINGEGIFKQFEVINTTTIEEDYEEEKERGYAR